MAKKIFVSYKHSDSSVQALPQVYGATTARDYINLLEGHLQQDHIYKGEKDNEDLGAFKDETIQSHLREKIFDSTVTIVLISKNMKEVGISEDEQWIPWEISYSLREKTREDRTSSMNAMLAVALPDEIGSYRYFVESNSCLYCSSTTWRNDTLFNILGKNMFNRNQKNLLRCRDSACGRVMHTGNDHSYIYPTTWRDFVANINGYIDLALEINANAEQYDILKTI